MNDNLNLCEILKDCPEGTKLYCTLCGEVIFKGIDNSGYPIDVEKDGLGVSLTKDGKFWLDSPEGECILFPSNDQRDWNKFKVPRLKKPKFDPKTLQPFDKVLVRDKYCCWKCGLFSHFNDEASAYKCICAGSEYFYCIPYNEETKHLVGTADEAPEYYRYWEK